MILICVKHNINKIHHIFEKQKQIFMLYLSFLSILYICYQSFHFNKPVCQAILI